MTAPITPDERAVMRTIASGLRVLSLNAAATSSELAYATDVPRLLDALDTAEAEAARLRQEAARPAPVWDEDTGRADLIDAVAQTVWNTLRVPGYTALDVACAVVREHLPVRPDREDVARALWRQTVRDNAMHDESVVPWDEIPTETREWWCVYADAVLALWPGESRATVQAETLRDAADEWHAEHYGTRPTAYKFLWDRADRLDPKEK